MKIDQIIKKEVLVPGYEPSNRTPVALALIPLALTCFMLGEVLPWPWGAAVRAARATIIQEVTGGATGRVDDVHGDVVKVVFDKPFDRPPVCVTTGAYDRSQTARDFTYDRFGITVTSPPPHGDLSWWCALGDPLPASRGLSKAYGTYRNIRIEDGHGNPVICLSGAGWFGCDDPDQSWSWRRGPMSLAPVESCTNCNLTFDQGGRITTSSGSR
ncbi:MAG: hypothetical protein ABIQ16_18790 [Polyangiaceae bacterium]